MFASFVIACVVAVICAAGWIFAELDLRDADHDAADLEQLLEDARYDRDVAEAWAETQRSDAAVVHTTLHLVDGGEA